MDFGTLLHMAKKNSESNKNESKYYSTKFAPPRKESKESKRLSDNIQKFLQKRELEEREKQRKEKEKLSSLLAMRDERSKNKIRKMLKVTKSANKSVLDDAIDTEHTAVTMEGPDQPDQDDYGYVSNAANDFYKKYMDKVKDVKEDKGFAPSRPQSLKDLSGTKERVKAAITKEIEEKKVHTRQRIGTSGSSSNISSASRDPIGNVARPHSTFKNLYDPESERLEEDRKKREEEQKKMKNRKPQPPPMDFQTLLKLAEKKQHEPIDIIPEVKKKDPERLLTMKEKRELEERQRAKEAREKRDRDREKERTRDTAANSGKIRKEGAPDIARMEPNGRIPKINQSAVKVSSYTYTNAAISKSASGGRTAPSVAETVRATAVKKPSLGASQIPSSSSSKIVDHPNGKHAPAMKNVRPSAVAGSSVSAVAAKPSTSASALTSSKNPYGGGSSGASKNQGGSMRDSKSIKPRQFPPADLQKTRQFPPPDVRKSGNSKRPVDNRKPLIASKRRILDDEDDEDEYDSEMDDFIDDGEDEEDYSSHIKAIFGYDKSKYRNLDDDDTAMESNFAQVQREEYISKKIGIQEDLEDMKLEAMEKKRKMLKKRRLD